ncbi:hypothetical protein D3C87_1650040 [compost metagenome]
MRIARRSRGCSQRRRKGCDLADFTRLRSAIETGCSAVLDRCRPLFDSTGSLDRAACAADQDFHLENFLVLFLEEAFDQLEIPVVDPGFQEGRRNGEPHNAF